MALFDLLKNPDSFPVGKKGHSKNITYLPGNNPKFHLQRVEGWDYQNNNDPILKGANHDNEELSDFTLRGGLRAHTDRAIIDVNRISKFLESNQGSHFKLRQGALQLLNPQVNTRTFNGGINLLAQVAASGLANFRRSGAFPEIAGTNMNSAIGSGLGDLLGGSIGTFISNAAGGTYLDIIKRKYSLSDHQTDNTRETVFGLGDPGKPATQNVLDSIIGDLNPFKKKQGYNVGGVSKVDKINFQSVYKTSDSGAEHYMHAIMNTPWGEMRDFVDFKFEVIRSDKFSTIQNIVFRAFLDGFGDNFSATHNEVKYNGRGETFYTYNKFNRSINIGFKIAAQSRHEMKPLYQKLNYLVAQTAPNYSDSGRIRTPFMRLTMGDYFHRIPGVLKTVNINWQKDYPWEIKLDPFDFDEDMKVLPHLLDVNVQFQPIHDFVPNNGLNVPFIGIGPDLLMENDWLLVPNRKKPTHETNYEENDRWLPDLPPVELELPDGYGRQDISKIVGSNREWTHDMSTVFPMENPVTMDRYQDGLLGGTFLGDSYDSSGNLVGDSLVPQFTTPDIFE
tara:strand:- start:633 stop:2318 length:1686 start_codon:yes stop_codon:yes gene_type:complete